jgi:DNA-binding MarR family transcriptional regulator
MIAIRYIAMPDLDSLDGADYRALADVRYHIRRFLQVSERIARDAGVEPQQHQLLLAVRGLPPDSGSTIGEVAERLQLRHNSTDELIRRAEERGLVRTHRGTDDRRQVIVRLTRSGEQALRELSQAHVDELRREAPGLIAGLQRLIAGRPK